MAKILLTSSNVMKFVNIESRDLILTPQMILTPGAKDKCRNNKIRIAYSDDNSEEQVEKKLPISSKEEENGDLDLPKDMPLDHVIKQILRKQFNIVSEVEVWNIANKVLEELKNT